MCGEYGRDLKLHAHAAVEQQAHHMTARHSPSVGHEHPAARGKRAAGSCRWLGAGGGCSMPDVGCAHAVDSMPHSIPKRAPERAPYLA